MHLILKKKEEFGSQIVSVVPYLLPDWYIARVNNRFYPFQDLGESQARKTCLIFLTVRQKDTVWLKHLIDMITDLHQLFLLSAVQGNARVLKARVFIQRWALVGGSLLSGQRYYVNMVNMVKHPNTEIALASRGLYKQWAALMRT